MTEREEQRDSSDRRALRRALRPLAIAVLLVAFIVIVALLVSYTARLRH